jgi:hypothetical protein
LRIIWEIILLKQSSIHKTGSLETLALKGKEEKGGMQA